jgi:hypothetical protein
VQAASRRLRSGLYRARKTTSLEEERRVWIAPAVGGTLSVLLVRRGKKACLASYMLMPRFRYYRRGFAYGIACRPRSRGASTWQRLQAEMAHEPCRSLGGLDCPHRIRHPSPLSIFQYHLAEKSLAAAYATQSGTGAHPLFLARYQTSAKAAMQSRREEAECMRGEREFACTVGLTSSTN